jgi:hypothetical protein
MGDNSKSWPNGGGIDNDNDYGRMKRVDPRETTKSAAEARNTSSPDHWQCRGAVLYSNLAGLWRIGALGYFRLDRLRSAWYG